MNQLDFIMEEKMTMIDDLAKNVNDLKYSSDKSLLFNVMFWKNKTENFDDKISEIGVNFHNGASRFGLTEIFLRLSSVGHLMYLWEIDSESKREYSIKETHEIFKFLDDNHYIGRVYLRVKEDLTFLQELFYSALDEDKNSYNADYEHFVKHRMEDTLEFIKGYDPIKFFEDDDEGFYESGKAFYDRLCSIEKPTYHECLTIFQKFATLLLLYVRTHFHERLIKPISNKYEDQ